MALIPIDKSEIEDEKLKRNWRQEQRNFRRGVDEGNRSEKLYSIAYLPSQPYRHSYTAPVPIGIPALNAY